MGVMDRDRCIKVSGLLGSTISMGEDLPVRFFCAQSKRAQRYYLKLSIKGQHPNNKFRHLLCAFIWGTQVIYPSSLNNQVARPTVRRAQVSTRRAQLAGRSSHVRTGIPYVWAQCMQDSLQYILKMRWIKYVQLQWMIRVTHDSENHMILQMCYQHKI